MQEDIFKFNYVPNFRGNKKISYRKIWDKFKKNKLVLCILVTIFLASSINMILMYNFLKLLETLV